MRKILTALLCVVLLTMIACSKPNTAGEQGLPMTVTISENCSDEQPTVVRMNLEGRDYITGTICRMINEVDWFNALYADGRSFSWGFERLPPIGERGTVVLRDPSGTGRRHVNGWRWEVIEWRPEVE